MAPDFSTVTTEAKSQLSTSSKYGGKMIFQSRIICLAKLLTKGRRVH